MEKTRLTFTLGVNATGLQSVFGPEGFLLKERADKESDRSEHLMSSMGVKGQKEL